MQFPDRQDDTKNSQILIQGETWEMGKAGFALVPVARITQLGTRKIIHPRIQKRRDGVVRLGVAVFES